MIYVIDGTYAGLLTCVFEAYERKEFDVQLETTDTHQPNIFIPERLIDSDISKFERIIIGIKKKLGNKQLPLFYQAYQSEDIQAWNCIFYLLIELFKGQTTILENFGDDKILYFHQTLKKVSRERHRMKAFIRFSKATDGLFFAIIELDFNFLPLIIKFFKDRYADQPWLIYDNKRDYGIHYDLQQINGVTLQPSKQKRAIRRCYHNGIRRKRYSIPTIVEEISYKYQYSYQKEYEITSATRSQKILEIFSRKTINNSLH